MGKITITPTTIVKELKEQFNTEFGGTLRIYNGRSEAQEDETLVSLGANEGSIEFRASRTVGRFCEEVMEQLNLKVKVATVDNWVIVLDCITLATIRDIPKQCTKQQMEEFVGYRRESDDKTLTTNDDKSKNENSNKPIDNMKENKEEKLDELIKLVDELANPVDKLVKVQKMLREIMADGRIVYSLNENYMEEDSDLKVADPIDVVIDYYDLDRSIIIKGVKFNYENGHLYCIEMVDEKDPKDFTRCWLSVPLDIRNITTVEKLLYCISKGWYVNEGEDIQLLNEDDIDEEDYIDEE